MPASYLAPPTVLRRVTALYEYVPARNDAGDLENEEEIDVAEGEELLLWESEGDWVLVGRESAKGVGFVPASYVEVRSPHAPSGTDRCAEHTRRGGGAGEHPL